MVELCAFWSHNLLALLERKTGGSEEFKLDQFPHAEINIQTDTCLRFGPERPQRVLLYSKPGRGGVEMVVLIMSAVCVLMGTSDVQVPMYAYVLSASHTLLRIYCH